MNSKLFSIGDLVTYKGKVSEVVAIGIHFKTKIPLLYLLWDKSTSVTYTNHTSRDDLGLSTDFQVNEMVEETSVDLSFKV